MKSRVLNSSVPQVPAQLSRSPNLALGNTPPFPDAVRMSHSHMDVRYVANLARLELCDAEVATFQPQLEAILRHAEALA